MTIYVVGDGRGGTVTLDYLSRTIRDSVVVCCNNPEMQFEIAKRLDGVGYKTIGDQKRVAAFCTTVEDALPLLKTGNYQDVVLTGKGTNRTMKKLEKLKKSGVV
jgi:hypothetical protein